MDTVDLDLLAYCRNREAYWRVKSAISKGMCVKESYTLLQAYGKYFKQFPDEKLIEAPRFKTWFRIEGAPHLKMDQHELYATIIDNVCATSIPEDDVFLSTINTLRKASALEEGVSKLKSGTLTFAEFIEGLRDVEISTLDSEEVTESINVEELIAAARTGGFYWRLEDLNVSLGPIHKGDFIVIAKRPEVGGTSFLCSELTYMLEQCPPGGTAIIFNNEEESWKVKSRIVSAALGVDYMKIQSNPTKYQKEWEKWQGDRTFLLVQDTKMTLDSIRAKCKEVKPDLIGINVILKVGGTGKSEDHDKLQALGEEFRVLASEWAPVIGIVQADPMATGEKFPSQDRIYKSKTALQGEADGLIMIGTDEEIDDERRYIYVAKNKLPPSPSTVTKLKHIKSEVGFDMGTGRFLTKNFPKHSREK